MPGPARKSKRALQLIGSWRADTRGDDADYGVADVRAPKFLKGEALVEWKRVMPLLVAARTARNVDRAAVVSYCEAWSDFRRASDALEAQSDYPQAIATGLVSAKNKTRGELLKCAAALGITPASATKVEAAPVKTEDKFAKFIRNRYDTPPPSPPKREVS